MGEDRYAALIAAKAAGQYQEHGSRESRYPTFDDGTVWFPEGYAMPGSAAGYGVLFFVAVASLIGTIGSIVDMSPWGWIFGPALAASCAFLGLLLRASHRKSAAREAALACGVFLFADAIIIREPGIDRVAARDSFTGTKVRGAFGGGGDRSIDYLTLLAGDGGEDLHTQLRGRSRPVVDAWLGEPS